MCLSARKRRKVQLACETNHHIEVEVYVKGWVCDFVDVDLAEKYTFLILGFCWPGTTAKWWAAHLTGGTMAGGWGSPQEDVLH